MTLTIELPADLEESLRQQAAKNGLDVNAFVLRAVQEKIAKARTFEEACAPFAQAVTAAGISDEEFDRFFEEARSEVWQERQSNRP